MTTPERAKATAPITSYTDKEVAIEMTFDPEAAQVSLAVYQDGRVSYEESVTTAGRTFVPYSADNNLLTHRVVLFATQADEYESEAALVAEVQAFIHRFVDLEPAFEEVAAHYVLMTWRYDLFKEVPYLRVLGTYGQGKSRFLTTIGSLCFKPIFASGASTVSPIFRLLDEIGGTLVLDEADFRASDERAEIVKILNNGHAEGFPILRSDVTPSKEFRPRAFKIFGPKVIATRHEFADEALESRCITATLGRRVLRSEIPISLPKDFERDSLLLRNKLLMYRFRRFEDAIRKDTRFPAGVPPRLAQILSPLLSVAPDTHAEERLIAFALGNALPMRNDEQVERLALSSIQSVRQKVPSAVTLQVVAEELARQSGGAFSHVTPRFIGAIVRRLGIEVRKSNGIFLIPMTAGPRVDALLRRYNISADRDIRDIRDERETPPPLEAPSHP